MDINSMEEKPIYLQRTREKLKLAKNVHEKCEVKICNQDFIIYPNVFNPNIFFGTDFLAQELIKIISEFHDKSPKILEIGTGAGHLSILAVLNGAIHATCTDINPNALKNVEENLMKYNLTDRITVMYSDVFSAVNSNEKFDIILWNYPFGHMNKSVEELEFLERAVIDPFYKSLDMYLKDASNYLNSNGGRLFLGFSNTAGYQEIFEIIAKKYHWTIHLINEIKSDTTPIMQIGMYELIKIQ